MLCSCLCKVLGSIPAICSFPLPCSTCLAFTAYPAIVSLVNNGRVCIQWKVFLVQDLWPHRNPFLVLWPQQYKPLVKVPLRPGSNPFVPTQSSLKMAGGIILLVHQL